MSDVQKHIQEVEDFANTVLKNRQEELDRQAEENLGIPPGKLDCLDQLMSNMPPEKLEAFSQECEVALRPLEEVVAEMHGIGISAKRCAFQLRAIKENHPGVINHLMPPGYIEENVRMLEALGALFNDGKSTIDAVALEIFYGSMKKLIEMIQWVPPSGTGIPIELWGDSLLVQEFQPDGSAKTVEHPLG